MKTKKLILASLLFALVLLVLFFLRKEPAVTRTNEQQSTEPKIHTAVVENQQEVGGVGTLRTVEDWRRMKAEDPYFEYKTPISFWGRVVDDRRTPVAGAEAEIVITDLSAEGTTKVKVFSDVDGLFSIANRSGKKLSVRVSKDGYRSPQTQNRFSFEYGDLTAADHFRPDARRPVVFTLVESAPVTELITREERVPLAPGASVSISSGSGGRNVRLQLELLRNEKENAGEWALRVSVPVGGVKLSTEEFPFEAPDAGFSADLILDRNTPKPATWPGVYQGGQFYVKTGQLYGVVTIKMIPGAKHLNFSLLFNPTGSRRLEPRL
ncbi:MAG: carboxypeptidase-like regulatory domain-containing protein [Candidatus Didemnitutus sp.]|nr:carboxypeptidase-like regulatory domain-containing protein [Candidatus Didemnitutus sp.]